MSFRCSAKAVVFIPVLLLTVLVWFDATRPAAVGAAGGLRIKQKNPVVNEGNRTKLTVTDTSGNAVTDAAWSSGSPDIASVDPATGEVRGVEQGFATVTATRGDESVSVFVTVTRLRKGNGVNVPGDTKIDSGGQLYLTHPLQNVILRASTALNSVPNLFAGTRNVPGLRNGAAAESLFAGPTAVGIDNRNGGGIYVADTLNHGVRKIGLDTRVSTVIGTGSPGVTVFDERGTSPLDKVSLKSPRGIAVEAGGNLFLADTDNHAVYYLDFGSKTLHLLAGKPGESGTADGAGRTARFSRPAGLALAGDGRVLAVADQDNNRVRLLELSRDGNGNPTCRVATVGTAPDSASRADAPTRKDVGTVFNRPRSVGFDGVGNLNVVDDNGAFVVTRPRESEPAVVPLAQPGVSFQNAVSVTVKGNESFVLDAGAPNTAEALKVVSVGAPVIQGLSREDSPLEGGMKIVVKGKNFAPESLVTLGDAPALKVKVQSATKITFVVPPQTYSGARTLSVGTRGGMAQIRFDILPKPLSELAPGEITTVAGSSTRFAGDGSRADDNAVVVQPQGLAVDGMGNLYVADHACSCVRRIDAETRVITTVAGNGSQTFGGDGGPATAAALNQPSGVALNRNGDLIIADTYNHRIRRVDLRSGVISTVAGTGTPGYTGDDVAATKTSLSAPTRMAFDSAGNLYVSDSQNHRVRRIDAETGIITTAAGNGREGLADDDTWPAADAFVWTPQGLALDRDDNLYIADQRGLRVRRVDARTKMISTVAGTGFSESVGPSGSLALSVPVGPNDILIDKDGNLVIADSLLRNHRIRRVDLKAGTISTLVGVKGDGIGGGDPNPSIEALLNMPMAVAVDAAGNLFISDFLNFLVRKVDFNSRTITPVAGSGKSSPLGEGRRASGVNISVSDMVFDRSGKLLFSDSEQTRIRLYDPATGLVTTIAGTGLRSFAGDGGPATDASFVRVTCLAVDSLGNIYLGDPDTRRIRRIDRITKIITTVAGNGNNSDVDNLDPAPALQTGVVPGRLAFDANDNLYFSDLRAPVIRRLDAKTGIISRVAGDGSFGVGGDGVLATQTGLSSPFGIAFDAAGNLYIAEQGKQRVRRVDARTGLISTVAGKGSDSFHVGGFDGDGGPAVDAKLNVPSALAFDREGDLFIADSNNNRIRRVDAKTGIITTIAGNGEFGIGGDGGPATGATLVFPRSLHFDQSGNLYVNTVQFIRAVKGAGR